MRERGRERRKGEGSSGNAFLEERVREEGGVLGRVSGGEVVLC
jgi:hypothetical protein